MQEILGDSEIGDLVKIDIGNYGDYIYLDKSNNLFKSEFESFRNWFFREYRRSGLAIEKESKKKYSKRAKREKGFDINQVSKIALIRESFCMEGVERINKLFGQDILKKYFKDSYSLNNSFVPDEISISDFIEEVAPIIKEVYKEEVKGV